MNVINTYDIAVIGGGHAGCEAALAAARLGLPTALFTLSLDAIANLPCNPSIGGSAKGHLVREIDALGGEMAKAADKATIQMRMLNRSKGPAIQALRAQIDRRKYSEIMKHTLELQPNLFVIQAEITDILTCNGTVSGVKTSSDTVYEVNAAIICTGTNLDGKIVVGAEAYSSGPDGMPAAASLSDSLRSLGIELFRFKTGTPARVLRSSLDFSKMEIQHGDDDAFSFSHGGASPQNKIVCYLTYTNERTHDIIRSNLHLSPLYSGYIKGVGPRYCPSIEDKVVRFADKNRHQLFIEPCGMNTEEMYIQGLSTSLPEAVQMKIIHSIDGLENAHIMRRAYAIEYDCINSLELYPTLEHKNVHALYGAGQFNCTSGYEEAAAQGLIAGINAALKLQNKEPLIIERASSYIGTMIDDLVTKGTNEPYRMMTSRSEHRLFLRQDNADYRLTEAGYKIGLIDQHRMDDYNDKYARIQKERERLEKTSLPPTEELNAVIFDAYEKHWGDVEHETPKKLITGVRMIELIKRPELTYSMIAQFSKSDILNSEEEKQILQTLIKYEGYIKRENEQARRSAKTDGIKLPEDIDYATVGGLRIEAQQKLTLIKPKTLGQASRISGVNPADIAVLMIRLNLR